MVLISGWSGFYCPLLASFTPAIQVVLISGWSWSGRLLYSLSFFHFSRVIFPKKLYPAISIYQTNEWLHYPFSKFTQICLWNSMLLQRCHGVKFTGHKVINTNIILKYLTQEICTLNTNSVACLDQKLQAILKSVVSCTDRGSHLKTHKTKQGFFWPIKLCILTPNFHFHFPKTVKIAFLMQLTRDPMTLILKIYNIH